MDYDLQLKIYNFINNMIMTKFKIKCWLLQLKLGQIVISSLLMIYHLRLLKISLVLVHHLSLSSLVLSLSSSSSKMLLISYHQKQIAGMLSLSITRTLSNSFLRSLFEEITCNQSCLCFICLFALYSNLRSIFLFHLSLAKTLRLEGQLLII